MPWSNLGYIWITILTYHEKNEEFCLCRVAESAGTRARRASEGSQTPVKPNPNHSWENCTLQNFWISGTPFSCILKLKQRNHWMICRFTLKAGIVLNHSLNSVFCTKLYHCMLKKSILLVSSRNHFRNQSLINQKLSQWRGFSWYEWGAKLF